MIIKNALVYTEDHKFEKKDVRIEDERIAEMRYRDLWIFIFMGR